MFEKLANIFRIPDLRKRVLFTLAMLAIYRLGGHLPTPGMNFLKLEQYFNQNAGSLLGFVDLFSGGNLRRLTHVCPWHHAVHHGIDHPAAFDRGV